MALVFDGPNDEEHIIYISVSDCLAPPPPPPPKEKSKKKRRFASMDLAATVHTWYLCTISNGWWVRDIEESLMVT